MLDALDIERTKEILREHGGVRVGALRQIYGAHFATGVDGTTTLDAAFLRLDGPSLLRLVREQDLEGTRNSTPSE